MIRATRPEWIIAAICEPCGYEGDAKEFEWESMWAEPCRMKCPRCGKGAYEIPYQALVHRGVIVRPPNTWPEYNCQNCDAISKWGPSYFNGAPYNWCGTCALAVFRYHEECAPVYAAGVTRYEKPDEENYERMINVGKRAEFREFLRRLELAREHVMRRKLVIPVSGNPVAHA